MEIKTIKLNKIGIDECRMLALIEAIKNGGEIETTDAGGTRIRIRVPAITREEITYNC